MNQLRIFKVLSLILVGPSVMAHAQAAPAATPATFLEWGAQQSVDPRTVDEMGRFADGRQGLSEDYRRDFAQRVQMRLVRAADVMRQDFLQGRCRPSVKVEFLNAGTLSDDGRAPDGAEGTFESALVRTQTVACLPSAEPQKILDIVTDATFRRSVVGELDGSVRYPDQTLCESTKAQNFMMAELLAPTHACSSLRFFGGDAQVSAVLGTLVWNDPQSRQPIYFRQGLTLAVRQSGGSAVFAMGYSRVKPAGWGESFARDKIVAGQKRFYGAVSQRLR